MTLSDFMNLATIEMNEPIPLRTVEAMKHIIEVYSYFINLYNYY